MAYFARSALGAVAMLLAASLAWADFTPIEKLAGAKAVDGQFGQQIRQAKASPDKDDDVQVANLLLAASQDAKNAPPIQAALAQAAMDLAGGAGTAEAATVAENALNRYADLVKMPPLERASQLVNLRNADMAKAKLDQKKEATLRMAKAVADLAGAYQNAGDMDNAAVQMARALSLAKAAGANDLAEELSQQTAQLQRERTFKKEMDQAQAELAAAVGGNNAPLIKSTHEKIGLLHLLKNGDPIAAAEPLAKAGHEWSAGAALLKKRAAGAALPAAEGLTAAEMLRKAAQRAELGAKPMLLEMQVDVYTEVESQLPPGSEQRLKVDVMCKQARELLARYPNPLSQALRKSLAGLNCLTVVNPDGSVQLTYAFASAKELADWTQHRGSWAVAGGQLALSGGAGGYAYHIVRFRADKPMLVSFAGATQDSMLGMLALNESLDDRNVNAHVGIDSRRGKAWVIGGLGAQDQSCVPDSGPSPYRVQLSYDGAGSFTCTMNGKPMGKFKGNVANGGTFRVGFYFRPQGGVSNLAISGTPVSNNPTGQAAPAAPVVTPPPAATKPPPPPAPAPGPRPRRPPRVGG